MEIDFAFQAFEHLGKTHFGRTWPMASIRELADELELISERAMTASVKRVKIDFSPSAFPSLRRVLDVLQDEQKKLNLANSPAEPLSRQENDRQFSSRFGERASAHEAWAVKLCVGLATGDVGVEQAVEACEHLERNFPNVGWRETQAFFVRRCRDMREAA